MNFRHLIYCLVLVTSCTPKPYVVMNKGIAGNNSQDLLERVDKDVLEQHPQLVILMVGTNDMVNSHKFIPYQQFAENYRRLVKDIRARKLTLLVMSALPVDTGYVFQRHQRLLFPEDPNYKLDSVTTVVKRIAAEEGAYYLDLRAVFRRRGEPVRTDTSLIINAANMGKEDGIHPTSAGYRLIATEIYHFMKTHRLLRKKHQIICFGDSITYGAFMEGAGTVDGDTYPAYLRKLLNKQL